MKPFGKAIVYASILMALLSNLHLTQGEGGKLSAMTSIQTVTSPNYPGNYPNNRDCTWIIEADAGMKVLVTITEFDTETCCDFLQIEDNGVTVADYRGTSKAGVVYVSSGPVLTLKFSADQSVASKGFSATYKQVGECGEKLTATPQLQTFTSPNYPAMYPENSDCFWEISTTSSTKYVELKIEQGATFAANDYVSGFDGLYSVFHLDGELNVLQRFISVDQTVAVYFHSDATANSGGFSATYKEVSCGGTFSVADFRPSTLNSPGYPFMSAPNLDCTYTIQAQAGNTLEVILHVDTEPCCDMVEIFDGQTSLGMLSGKRNDSIFRTTGQTLRLHYTTDEDITETGFRARYRQISKPVVVDMSGTSTCSSVADPHITTFDGALFDFHGICSYVMVEYKSETDTKNNKKNTKKSKLTPFTVEAFQEHRTDPTVAYVHKVQITIGKATFQLCKTKKLKVRIKDGPFIAMATPHYYDNGVVSVTTSGNTIRLKAKFLEVAYSTPSNVEVTLSNTYSGKVTGLCGDINGVRNDDFPLNPYVESKGRYFLAERYADEVKTDSKDTNMNCNHVVDTDECTSEDKAKYAAECSLLTNKNDPIFSECNREPAVDPNPFYEDCIFDACANKDAHLSIADNFYDYTKKCKAIPGITIGNWKKRLKLEPVCKANSHFELCGPTCPATCVDHNPDPCNGTDEGCFCDEGFVLSNDKCVRIEDCGCESNGEYYMNKQVFYNDTNCMMKCKCNQGTLTCETDPCSEAEKCDVAQNGHISCMPMSMTMATAAGDPHYYTFDKRYFDFMGVGTFTIVRTNDIPPTDDKWLEVEAENEFRYGHTGVSYVKSVTVKLRNRQTIVEIDKQNVVKLDGVVVNDYDSPLFQIRTSGSVTALTTEHYATIKYSYGHSLSVSLPSSYSEKVTGLFGNFNGDANDDLPANSDINSHAKTFQVFPTAVYPEPVSMCEGANLQQWNGPTFCGLLASKSFAKCNEVVDVTIYREYCVFDVCANNGDRTTLQEALEDYVSACQAEGLKVCDWRKATGFQDMECQANSHYEGCATLCPDTCLNPYASDDCHLPGTIEGCVCNAGYVKEGNTCIRHSQCQKTTEEGMPSPIVKEKKDTFFANASIQTFTSPGYPKSYPNSLDCYWVIETDPGMQILIIITMLDTELCCDVVEILENNITVSKFQGLSEVGIPYLSTGSNITLEFRSDQSDPLKGFSATYRQVRNCGERLTATSQLQIFTSLNYPAMYPENSDCYWEISTTSSTKYVEIEIEQGAAFAANDFISIYEGRQRVFHLEGELTTSQRISSSGQNLTVYFHSDASANSGGFSATYKEISCGGTFEVGYLPDTLTSPGYPFFSSDNLECMFILEAQTGNVVEVVLDVDTASGNDFVEVYDGQTSLQKLNGSHTNVIFESTGKNLSLQYKTDESTTRPGFRARYRQIALGSSCTYNSGRSTALINTFNNALLSLQLVPRALQFVRTSAETRLDIDRFTPVGGQILQPQPNGNELTNVEPIDEVSTLPTGQICPINLVTYNEGNVTFSVSIAKEGVMGSHLRVQKMRVNFKGTDVQIYLTRKDVMVNSETVELPYINYVQGLYITGDDAVVSVISDAGMTASYDLEGRGVSITLPNQEAELYYGLCVIGDRISQLINESRVFRRLPKLNCRVYS